jgi:flagellar FliL protein
MAAKAKGGDGEASEGTDGAEAAPAKKTLPLKVVIIVAGAVLLLGGAGTAAFLMLGGKKHEEAHVEAPVKPVAFLDLPDIVVNLAGGSADRTQYLKIKIVLEVADQTIATMVQPLMPRVVDTFQTYQRELRTSDLEGSAGLYRLRDELTRRVNASISPNRINAVLFKEIVVQ